jgi:hypothetical protein
MQLSRGTARELPIRVASASVVEVRTAALTCPACAIGTFRIEDHVSVATGVRRVDVICRHCSTPRSLWFRLEPHDPN